MATNTIGADTYDPGPATYSEGKRMPLEYDKKYIFTPDSLIKGALAILGMITLICALVPPWGSAGSWVEFVSSSAMVFTILLWFYYFFQLEDRIKRCGVPIRIIELGYSVVYTLFYLIAGIVSAVDASKDSAIAAATVFCFMSVILFCLLVYLKFAEYREVRESRDDGSGETGGKEMQSPGGVRY